MEVWITESLLMLSPPPQRGQLKIDVIGSKESDTLIAKFTKAYQFQLLNMLNNFNRQDLSLKCDKETYRHTNLISI